MTFPLTRSRSRARFFGTPFSPVSLFANGEQGAWYDPSDPTTLFQDAAGTTPTVMETRVRLMLDKSKGGLGSIGADIVVNGDFSSGAAWTLSAGGGGSAVISSGTLTLSGGSATFPNATQSGILVSGRLYKIVLVVSTAPAAIGALSIRVGGSTTNGPTNITAAGTYTFYVTADGADLRFLRNSGYTDTVVIDSVSAQLIPGNHATAPSDASSPILRARYNLLTYSEQFDNAAWAKENASSSQTTATTDPLGGLTAETLVDNATNSRHIIYQQLNASFNVSRVFSVYAKQNTLRYLAMSVPLTADVDCYSAIFDLQDGVVSATKANGNGTVSAAIQSIGNGWYRCSITGIIASSGTGNFFPMLGTSDRPGFTGSLQSNNMPAYSGTGQSLYIWGADLRLASDAALNIPAYQSITTATSYDTNGFPPYLAFDGTDDSFSTASIDFTGTDKMTVFAGVTKLSDAASGRLVELSAAPSTTVGAFAVSAPSGAASNYGFDLTGDNSGAQTIDVRVFTYAAPINNVVSASMDLSQPTAATELTMRVNGLIPGTIDRYGAASAGTGSFGNHPLFIGRRNNTSNPLNGRIYSLIIRGAATTTPLIASTEQWVAGKMRLPI